MLAVASPCRKLQSFLPVYCGSRVTGYVDSGFYRSGMTKVARAMTISGAAADSAIGGKSFLAQSFAATLFNIRLGQWMENPAFRNGRYAARRENWVFWPKYLLMEALGLSDARSRLVHLSDGGHTGDNLGIVPLLQRRCRLILVVDAEYDPEYSFASLLNAIRFARIDLGVQIDIDLKAMQPDKQGFLPSHFAIGRIHYPARESGESGVQELPETTGYLVVLKSSLVASDEAALLKFRQRQPGFPQQSTGDQFFSEMQFEAHRMLGRAMIDTLFERHPELAQGEFAPDDCRD